MVDFGRFGGAAGCFDLALVVVAFEDVGADSSPPAAVCGVLLAAHRVFVSAGQWWRWILSTTIRSGRVVITVGQSHCAERRSASGSVSIAMLRSFAAGCWWCLFTGFRFHSFGWRPFCGSRWLWLPGGLSPNQGHRKLPLPVVVPPPER